MNTGWNKKFWLVRAFFFHKDNPARKKVVQRVSIISIVGSFQDPDRWSPEQSGFISYLTLIWARGWTMSFYMKQWGSNQWGKKETEENREWNTLLAQSFWEYYWLFPIHIFISLVLEFISFHSLSCNSNIVSQSLNNSLKTHSGIGGEEIFLGCFS